MISLSLILTALASTASAYTAADPDPTLQLCIGTAVLPDQCFNFPVQSTSCVDFIGGLTGLDKQVTTADVPEYFECALFKNFACLNNGTIDSDEVILPAGMWNLSQVMGEAGSPCFANVTSSFNCRRVV
ncbi:hypothetical protein FB45DRAFT_965014 [Roridomyces roridus]|uniref:Uncharacterized protein n=1 Tax=Roridomyces roridus TaxID=1738132 RepID=A0AAD7AX46_9AGAR|nr:hypothetical protein FB45DRAFT_965014 [Roridomyces roridus]